MIGKTISHYRVLEKLGQGAMGAVYKALDLKLDRPVAIKFLTPGFTSDLKARFAGEAKAASALDHTNICTIYEFDETPDGEMFIVMAYCPGENLRARLKGGTLPLEQAISIALQVAQGLVMAHSMGVLHRDVKPANLMLTPNGVKIVDFGVAKLLAGKDRTDAGAILGTIPYMSPEQLNAKPVDARTDIWSWGAVAYEMLAGRQPFQGESELTTAELILKQEPLPLTHFRPDIPGELDAIIMQSLQKRPEDRPQTAQELVQAMRPLTLGSGMAAATAESVVQTPSIAVLPFVNLSPEPDSEYFSDGLTEELIHALSQLHNLRVVSRTSAFEFKAKPQSVRRIGAQLKVTKVVEGSVRKLGQRLRVSAQLVSTSDGYCLWSQRFDREIKDVFEIQDEIANQITEALKTRLSQDAQPILLKRRTENVEAYDLYLRGRFQWNKRSGEGLQRSLEYFELALAQDPGYAPAYSGIADYHIAVASWGLATPTDAWPKAKEAAERALAIDDTLAEAHASMGTIHMWYEWNWSAAEQDFRRAIDLNPGHPNAHVQYNLLFLQTGRFGEAEREIRTALATDPLSIRINSYLAGLFHYRGEYDRSLEQCGRALELDPKDIELHIVLALNYEQKGMYKDAIRELEQARELSDNNPLILGPLGSCYAAAGDHARARSSLAELDRAAQVTYVAPITWVMIYLGLREFDRAFEWLEKAAQVRDVLICYLGVGPIYECIRSDPRYTDLVRRIGLAPDAETRTSST
jgi:serine/threonine protein kinase/Flp pilus assembly protein TadD